MRSGYSIGVSWWIGSLLLVGNLYYVRIASSLVVVSSVIRNNIKNDVVGRHGHSVGRKFQAIHLKRRRRRRRRKQQQQQQQQQRSHSLLSNAKEEDVDAMRARAAKLRLSLLRQQLELQELERQISCCHSSSVAQQGRWMMWMKQTFEESSSVLWNKMNNSGQTVGEYAWSRGTTGVRIVSDLMQHPNRLVQLMDPATPTLVPHVPAILARLDKLESHVAPILERVLNNRRHLASIEPYLDQILERFDDIEPHLPWILDNIDALAPYTGLLLKHIDELLIYAEADDDDEDPYALARQLLPYLEFYVSKLDVIGPHLPLLRPHVPLLLKHDRIGKISPHIDKLFARGYKDLSASANLDILLFWFGWTLQVPKLPGVFFAIPGSPRLVSFLAKRMPKRFTRQNYCRGVSCVVDNDYGTHWNKLSST